MNNPPGRFIYASQQRLDQPLQLMVDLFEVGPASQAASYPKMAIVHRVLAT